VFPPVGHGCGTRLAATSPAQPVNGIAAPAGGHTSRCRNHIASSGRFASKAGTCHIRSIGGALATSATPCHR
jgi:hypothetical protein